ncbi:MAG: hypothetical protein ACR2IP_10265, partial [Solirubrobacteraceae bacterium]
MVIARCGGAIDPSGPPRSLVAVPRATSIHVCSECAHQSPRWAGRCPGCGEWNTLVEEARPRGRPGGLAGGPGGASRAWVAAPIDRPNSFVSGAQPLRTKRS